MFNCLVKLLTTSMLSTVAVLINNSSGSQRAGYKSPSLDCHTDVTTGGPPNSADKHSTHEIKCFAKFPVVNIKILDQLVQAQHF